MELIHKETIIIFEMSFINGCNFRGDNRVFNYSFKEYRQYRKRILRMFSAQAQGIYPVYIHYLMSHSQNIILYICKQYINIIQRNVAAENSLLL